MKENKGLLNNKYYSQLSELLKLYNGVESIYIKLADLEKNGQKDSKEYADLVDLLNSVLEIEKNKFMKFDNLTSKEMQDAIKYICISQGEEENELVDKTRYYQISKVKRLISRIRDYTYLRNDSYDLEPADEIDENKTFTFNATNGMRLQVKLSDLKALGFTYEDPNEEDEEEKNEERLESIKVTNQAFYYKEKLINANFYKLIEEIIEKTDNEEDRNTLIDYKYNLIFNSISLETAFAKGKNISEQTSFYKYAVEEFIKMYPYEYENNYSNLIEDEAERRIQEIISKEYSDQIPNENEAFEDKMDLLYFKALIASLNKDFEYDRIKEYANIANEEVENPIQENNINEIKEIIKETELKLQKKLT